MSNNSEWNAESKEEKRALLTQILRKAARQPKSFPLSHGQQALWFLYKLAPQSWAYNTLFTAHIRSDVDTSSLRHAFQTLISRHPSLRTTYTVRDGKPLQQIHDHLEIHFEEINATTWNWDELNKHVAQEARRPFDLEQGPLLRVSLFTRSARDNILMLAIHHIASDFWSLLVLMDELRILYPAQKAGIHVSLPPLKVSYVDYVRWQTDMLAGAVGERLWSYWCDQLGGELPLLNLPTDRPRPPIQTYQGASYAFKLTDELTQMLKTLAQTEKSTLYMTLLAAFQVLLYRYTSQEDILVGSPTSGRSRREFSEIVGYFVNLVVLRADLSGNPTFKTFLRQVRQTVLSAIAHQDYPFGVLVERLQMNRDPSRSPIFQVSFALQKPQRFGEVVELFAPNETGVRLDLGGLSLEPFEMAQQEGQFDLTLEMVEARNSLFGVFKYNTDLFDAATIARMAGHFNTILTGIVAAPEQKLSDLPLLSAEEHQQLLFEWNHTQADYPQDVCIHQLFEAAVERTPDAIAVVFEHEQLTYRELNARANQVAHHLQALGVKQEVLVGICVERSPLMVVGLLGILKAGGAYVPLDPAYPPERLAFMLEDANATVLLTQQHLVSGLPEHQAMVVCLDGQWQSIVHQKQDNPECIVTTENLAYAIYTSGSTGKPKGVAVEHSSLLNLVFWHQQAFSVSSTERATQIANAAFDACGWELWPYLTIGACIHFADDLTRNSPQKLQDWLLEQGITISFVPTPLAQRLLALDWPAKCALHTLLIGGDKLIEHPQVLPFKVVNNYGPTENTVVTTSGLVPLAPACGVPTIGRPIANTQTYVLDQHLQPLPIGVVGELYIGGAGLARGYLNRPELTQEKFIPNPFVNSEVRSRKSDQNSQLSIPNSQFPILYKTGDLVRYLADGDIEYLGRSDNQVKIRGFRIELGEIEAILSQHSAVQQSVVIVREDNPGNKQLVAYVVLNQSFTPSIKQLHQFLKQKLPEYMVPSVLVMQDSLPLTANGKIDRAALPPPLAHPESPSRVAPITPIAEMLATIWTEILQIEQVGIQDNFFELGGHSLLATQLLSQVQTTLGVELPLRSVFEAPTLKELAERIEHASAQAQQLSKPPLLPRTPEQAIPLSFAQARLWFLAQLQPDSAYYNIPAAVRLVGQLNISALESSLNCIIRRHQALRTNFVTQDGQPVQVIADNLVLKLNVVDLSNLALTERQSNCQRLATQEAICPFEVASQPLVRAKLLQLAADEYVLLLTMHHLVADGWSIGILLRELATLYPGFCNQLPDELPALPISYADYALWQRQWLQTQVLELELSYWKKQLSDTPAVLSLPTDRPRPATQSFRGAHHSFALSIQLSLAVRRLSQRCRVTVFMTLLAAFQTLLYRYTGQADICVGSLIANRNHSQTEQLIGLFVNTLVLRTNLSGNPSFQELLGRVREVALGAYAHQDLPFEQLVEALQPKRSLSHQPLFQVMFVLQNAPMSALELPGLTISPLESDSATAKFDLTLSMSESSQGLVGSLEYNTDLFEADTISRMLGHFQTLLEGIVADPLQRLADLPLLTPVERQQLLFEWNHTQVDYPNICIHELFEAQVERTPDAPAVVFKNQQLTYRELNALANQVAHHLVSLGVVVDSLVGLCLERSPLMVVGLLGILKAGGAYVPLDLAYPQERLAFMLEDAQVSVLLTQQQIIEKLPEHQARLVCLDTDWEAITKQSQANSLNGVTPNNLAYVIYTSGSTGKPKGVAIEQRSTVALLHWARDVFAPEDLAGVLASTSICFDLSVFELFAPLSWGGKCILAENALQLPTLPTAFDVTLINTVPSAIAELLRVDGLPSSVRTVNLAGEPLHNKLVQQLYQRDSVQQVFNLYGPSEDTTYSTFALLNKGDSIVTIGRPIANTEIYVLDQHLQPLPIGVVGELYIGGAGLARGYLNRPELTQEKFIPNPFVNSEFRSRKSDQNSQLSIPNSQFPILYKTGDLARYLADGNIEYLGRSDNQVKIRGFRIELGEIEAILSQHPALQQSVVIVREDTPGNKQLVAYVVVNQSPVLTRKELQQFLKQKLPEYMVPSVLVMLSGLPLTANGKIDRAALPKPELVNPQSPSFVAPITPIQEMLATIWAQILGLEQVGSQDNFFELGGHSLLATQLLSQVRTTLGVELPLRSVFEAPTLEELGEYIERASERGQQLPKPPLVPRTAAQAQAIPLSFAQARLWFLAQLEPESAYYNIPAAVRLVGQLNVSALESSLNCIIRRHEALRTNFVTQSGQPVQAIADTLVLTLNVVDLSNLPRSERQSNCQRLATTEAICPFDVASEPLVRAKLLQLATHEYVLLLTMHHLVADGWSIGIFIRELATLYPGFCNHLPSELPALPISYADFALWQRQWLDKQVLELQLSYWKQQLSNAPAVLSLPTDRPRPATQSYRGAHQSFVLAKQLSRAVTSLSQRCRVTLFMTLLAAFQTLLYRYTAQADILVGTPIANRNLAETEGLIGLFVNTLVLRTNLGDNPRFTDVLSRVREVTLDAYAHQDLPFEQLVEALQPARDLSHTPLFQVMFVLQNAPMPSLELKDLTLTPLQVETSGAKFDLTLSLENTEQGLVGAWEYNTDLFDTDTIARMAGHFKTILTAIVANPDQRLSDLPLLDAHQKQQLVLEWNDTQVDYPSDICIHQLFEATVERTPDAIAVVFENQLLSYRELNTRANQLAHHLQRLGVKQEVLVGICLERGVDLIVGLLGILKAGGAYVPLDPSYPSDRLGWMLEDAQVPVLLTNSAISLDVGLSECLRASLSTTVVVCLDKDEEIIAGQSNSNPTSDTKGDNLAYVMYTSGSTGKPKGVAVLHKAVNRLVCNTNYVNLSAEDKIAQVSNTCFDAATFEIWGALLNGAQLVGLSRDVILSPQDLALQLRQKRISVLFLTTALFELVASVVPHAFNSLRYLLFGGEVVNPRVVQQVLKNKPPQQLLHVYGPTESTTFSSYYCVQDVAAQATSIPIGRPIANTQIYLLDQYQKPVPIGVVGELYIGGDGLARGYLNRQELTASRFIPSPFNNQEGTRLYKTGDLGRYLPDGNIEYQGRIDNQVKIRGWRIELGEIETILSQHPDVVQSVVMVRCDIQGEQRLASYLVPQPNTAPSMSELRQFLKQKLPEYMVPSVFVMLSTLPLTPNGKVDRHALPPPEMAHCQSQSFVAPITPIQEILAAIWAEILHIEQVGIQDNFFELGGHSLLVTQFIGQVREAFSVEIPLRCLFESPTIAELSQSIEAACQSGEGLLVPAIEPVFRDRVLPLSFAQARLWFLDQLEGGSATYNIPVALRLTGLIHMAALEQAIGEIVQRHEVLRTTFPMVDGVPVQALSPTLTIPLLVVDLQSLPEGEQSTSVRRLATEAATRLFDLASGPLLRTTLLRLGKKSHVLLLTMHHIISDGWSLGIFVRELSALYEAFSNEAPSPLPALPIQYADFTHWQQQWLSGEVLETQLNYWKQQLAGAAGLLELPTDRPRPLVQTFRGNIESFKIDQNLTRQLLSLSQHSGATLFMTLLAAFVILLSRYSDREDIVVGSPIANRNRAEIEGLIGFFANILALRIEVIGTSTFRELLERVREVTMGAYAHQDLPFEKIVEALQPERTLSRNPLVQVVFALQNAPIPTLELPGLNLIPLEFDFGLVRFDLEVHLRQVPDGLNGYFVYSTDLYDAATIARMAGHFQTLLTNLVANPQQQLSELPLLTEAERQQLLVESNRVQADTGGGNEEQMLAKLDGLSDEEVNALLNQMLAE